MYRCNMCPNKCGVDRQQVIGKCGATKEMCISKIQLFKYEEPCISGQNGTGAIFFSGCNLHCVYCQNYEISQKIVGNVYTPNDLAYEMMNLQRQGAHSINLVTPTIYVDRIIETIIIAKNMGLSIPIIYNTNGYENIETIKKLKGYIDVYLPDFKYASNTLGKELSNVINYYDVAMLAIKEMISQQAKNIYDANGNIQRGVIIRHLILPNHINNTKEILKSILKNFGNEVCISVMAQYFPTYLSKNEKYKINRKVSSFELKQVEKYMFELNLNNGYIQKLSNCEEEYVPKF